MSDLATKLDETIRRTIGRRLADAVIDEKALLRDHLGITSLEMIAILTETCDSAGIDLMSLSDVDIARMQSVGDVVGILRSKLRG